MDDTFVCEFFEILAAEIVCWNDVGIGRDIDAVLWGCLLNDCPLVYQLLIAILSIMFCYILNFISFH